tara:strand:- start:629 stop:1090 length:462 start_codon:yes stop_codon:yes gene_type:complete
MRKIKSRRAKKPLGVEQVKKALKWEIKSDIDYNIKDEIADKIKETVENALKEINIYRAIANSTIDSIIDTAARMIVDDHRHCYPYLEGRYMNVDISPDYIDPCDGEAGWAFSIRELCEDTHYELDEIIETFEDGLAILKRRKEEENECTTEEK